MCGFRGSDSILLFPPFLFYSLLSFLLTHTFLYSFHGSYYHFTPTESYRICTSTGPAGVPPGVLRDECFHGRYGELCCLYVSTRKSHEREVFVVVKDVRRLLKGIDTYPSTPIPLVLCSNKTSSGAEQRFTGVPEVPWDRLVFSRPSQSYLSVFVRTLESTCPSKISVRRVSHETPCGP